MFIKLFKVRKSLPVLFVLLLLLATVIAAPAAAQGPEEEDGTVNIALSFHGGFSFNPASNFFTATPQTVPSNGIATTEYVVTDVEDLYSVTLAFDYHTDVVEAVKSVRAGSLFDDLTPGVDYIITTDLDRAVALHPSEIPVGFSPLVNRRSYVNISVINYNHASLPVRGNGSLVKIDWQIENATAGTTTPIAFTIVNLRDEFGNFIEPCFGGATCSNPLNPPISPDFGAVGLLEVGANPPGLNLQVALEGGKSPIAGTDGVEVTVTQYGAEIPATVDAEGFVNIPASPPFSSLEIKRDGYLRYRATNVQIFEPPLIVLLAGDINKDDIINIYDISLMASNLNRQPVGDFLERMDYNADNFITIADLALVAKNYGTVGPMPY